MSGLVLCPPPRLKCHSHACRFSRIIVVNISVTLRVLWNFSACTGMCSADKTETGIGNTSQCKWCVFELGFGDDAGWIFWLCHSFRCLVRACEKVPQTIPLFTSLPSSSHILSSKTSGSGQDFSSLRLCVWLSFCFSFVLTSRDGSWGLRVLSVHVWAATTWKTPKCSLTFYSVYSSMPPL